jgi:small-conductance mechanosensitive channel
VDTIRHLRQVNLLHVAAVAAAAFLVIGIAQRLLPWLAERLSGKFRPYILASVPVLRLLVIVLAAGLIIAKIIEPTFENLIALLGAAGLAISFAFKDYVSSLLAGIVTLYEMPYGLGDWISVTGAYGEVKAIGLRAVEIVTPEDTLVVIPHLMLWNNPIFKANDNRSLQCVADFYLHPRHDTTQVRETLNDVGLTGPYLQIRKSVSVMVSGKPWGTHFRLKAHPVDPRDQFRFTTDLTIRGKTALVRLGVEFAIAPAAVGNKTGS